MKTSIRCAVTCYDASGIPAIFRCTVEVDQEQYALGRHYELAVDKAIDSGYSDCCIVYDENDGPDYLFPPEYPAEQYASPTYSIDFPDDELEEIGAFGCPSFFVVNSAPPLRLSQSEWLLVTQLLLGKAEMIRRGFYDEGEDRVAVNDPGWSGLLESMADKILRFFTELEGLPSYEDLLDDGIKGGEGG